MNIKVRCKLLFVENAINFCNQDLPGCTDF